MADEKICKNCKYYHIDEIPDTPCASSLIMALGKALGNGSIENYCEHPCMESDDGFVWTRLSMKEDDYCSRFEKKEKSNDNNT
jgi:hypothetical protein